MEHSSRKNKWATLISCSLSCFLGFVDFAIVNTALPVIQNSLGASMMQLQWVISAYNLALCTMIVMQGRLADLWGRRRMNQLGVIAFGVSSLFAGLSPNPGWLIFWRVVQGLSTAAVIPSALALITHTFPQTERGKAIGIWSSITGLGWAVGPVLGGFLVSALSWRWIFYINIPFVAICLLLNLLFVKESRDESAEKKIDLKGVLLLTLGICSLVYAFINAPDWEWKSMHSIAFIGFGCVCLILFYFSEKQSKNPTIQFHLFANRTFFSCTLVLFCNLFIMSAIFFLAPLYLQNIQHQAPFIAGLMLLPITACIVLFSPFIGHLVDKFSAKKLMQTGLILYFLGIYMQSYFYAKSSIAFILISFFLLGLAWAFVRNPATTKGIGSVPPQMAGTATGVIWTIQNIGGALGVALAVTVFRMLYETTHNTYSFLLGYQYGMRFLCALAALAFFAITVFMKEKRAEYP